jgi:two-component system, OmpR family, alkaline phosphatase synthesis response regulator PhoP
MYKKILVVDDEVRIADTISYALSREGFNVEVAYDGEVALKKINTFSPIILILDIMMPKLNGYEVLKRIEKRNVIGVIMLTAKSDIVDKVLGLELGADDFIIKPFDMRELTARVNSLVRRLEKVALKEDLTLGKLKITTWSRKAMIEEATLDLTPKEFDLLAILVSHPERVYSREELLDVVWGREYVGGTRTVDIHMRRLRQKLGVPHDDMLQTVHGVGYRAAGVLNAN